MEMEKSKVLIQFLVIFRQSGDVLFSPCARRLRGYTATYAVDLDWSWRAQTVFDVFLVITFFY